MLDKELCACGSGLRRVRCCQADAAAMPDQPGLAVLDAPAQEAAKLFNEKKPAEAEVIALKLLDLAPNHRVALRVLFEIRKAEKKMPAAEALARRLADLPAVNKTHEASGYLQLAQLMIGQGRFADAEAPARQAVIASPRDATMHHVMGVVLTETGRLKTGEAHYRKAAALLGRDDGMVLANIAWNLKLQNRLDEAAAVYAQALLLRPDNSRGVGGFAQVEMARGDVAAAIKLLDDGLGRWPEDRTLRLLRAMADLEAGEPEAVLRRLKDAPEALMPAELCVRGQACARLERVSEAVAAYAQAKKFQRERYGQRYEPEAFVEKAATYKSYFTSDRMSALPRAAGEASGRAAPVFLLGFPRSGMALLERMLARMPGFAAGGEPAQLAALAALLPKLAGSAQDYPAALDDLLTGDGLDVPARLRARYLAEARAGDAGFITDRSQDLFWHLGLVKLLFPESAILHVLRHPLDVMLSNLAQDKKLEANCQVSMLAAARHYDLSMSMIRHYRGQLALRYLPVRYEALVAQPGAVLAQVAGFVKNQDVKVTDGGSPEIHQRGLYRYRRYQAVLPQLFAEVMPVLQPWIDELGYGEGA